MPLKVMLQTPIQIAWPCNFSKFGISRKQTKAVYFCLSTILLRAACCCVFWFYYMQWRNLGGCQDPTAQSMLCHRCNVSFLWPKYSDGLLSLSEEACEEAELVLHSASLSKTRSEEYTQYRELKNLRNVGRYTDWVRRADAAYNVTEHNNLTESQVSQFEGLVNDMGVELKEQLMAAMMIFQRWHGCQEHSGPACAAPCTDCFRRCTCKSSLMLHTLRRSCSESAFSSERYYDIHQNSWTSFESGIAAEFSMCILRQSYSWQWLADAWSGAVFFLFLVPQLGLCIWAAVGLAGGGLRK